MQRENILPHISKKMINICRVIERNISLLILDIKNEFTCAVVIFFVII